MIPYPTTFTWLLPKSRFNDLIALLIQDGYEVVGPTVQDDAIVYAPVRASDQLPIGWTDRQEAGSYRLEKRRDQAFFGYAVGPHSWKKYLFPPSAMLWQARRGERGWEIEHPPAPPARAFLGVRTCELHAMAVQDRVFLNRQDRFTDPIYAEARGKVFLVAVECEHPGGTCFCASMQTGPAIPDRADAPSPNAQSSEPNRTPLPIAEPASTASELPLFDLALTELDDGFVVRCGSAAGRGLIERLGLDPAGTGQVEEGRRRVEAAAREMGRMLNADDLQGLLRETLEHSRWDDVARRCLSCTNCTLVCPTCFCSAVSEVTDLAGETAGRRREWDSCFNPEFAYVHGGNIRPSTRGRYRQWLTHKFGTWHDQFGVSGCVGCGRCITWCPVGIDVTEELAALREPDRANKETHS
jgi:ferredoxin